MKAKDTVMKPNDVQIMPYLKDFITTVAANDREATEIIIGRMVLEIAQAQAEISFKAGIKEVTDDMRLAVTTGNADIVDLIMKYEATLKEWGIEES